MNDEKYFDMYTVVIVKKINKSHLEPTCRKRQEGERRCVLGAESFRATTRNLISSGKYYKTFLRTTFLGARKVAKEYVL